MLPTVHFSKPLSPLSESETKSVKNNALNKLPEGNNVWRNLLSLAGQSEVTDGGSGKGK